MAAFETARAIEAYREGLATFPDDAMLLWRAARALSNRMDVWLKGRRRAQAQMSAWMKRSARAGCWSSACGRGLVSRMGEKAIC